MSGLKATEQDRLYLSGAIHRMGERTGAAAERILDDLDTLLAENAKLRAVAEAAREYRETCNPGVDPCAERALLMSAGIVATFAVAALAALEAP